MIPIFAGLHLLPPLAPPFLLFSFFFHSTWVFHFSRLSLSFSLCFVLHHLISLRSRPGGLPRICTLIVRPRVRPMILSRMSRNNCPLFVLILCSHLFQVIHVHLEDHHSVRKRSIDQNLRIKLYYDESVYK